MEERKARYARTEQGFRALAKRLPEQPKAVLVVTGHWEEDEFTVSTSPHPPMFYDYYNFPEHTYHIQYPAPGAPSVAARVVELLGKAGIKVGQDAHRGFDHGTFIPFGLIYPDADMPIVMMSIKPNYDPAEHVHLGEALAPLRDEGVLIAGSGMTFHNRRAFGHDGATPVAEAFEAYLNKAVTETNPKVRNDMLVHWEDAPGARLSHPQEDHLIPLMVAAGAAGNDSGQRVIFDHVNKVAIASYGFGTIKNAA
jgi:aromatic ring-opening dioxygenase catalytic subunit (LigB family)